MSLRQRLLEDIKRTEFIPLKILTFFNSSALLVLYPFLTLHARSIGLDEKQYGTLSGILPLVAVIMPPITGMIADRIGNFKHFVSFLLILSGLSGAALVIVPKAAPQYPLDTEILINTTCSVGSTKSIVNVDPSCSFIEEDFQIQKISCKFQCSSETVFGQDSLVQNVNDWCTASDNCMPELLPHDLTLKTNKTVNVSPNDFEVGDVKGTFSVNACPSYEQITLSNISFIPVDTVCSMSCVGVAPRHTVCKEGHSLKSVIFIYFIIRFVHAIFSATTVPMVASAIVTVIKEKKGDLGFQRVFSNLGIITLSPISGYLIDYFSTEDEDNYDPAFFIYCLLCTVCAITLQFVDLQFKSPSKTVVRDVLSYLKKAEFVLLLMVGLVIGFLMGIVDTFLFWLLQDLGAQSILMSLTVTVGTLFGIPILILSTQIIGKIGCVNAVLLVMATYVVRLLGYSIIQNPWLAMPFEALECITSSLMLVTIMTYGGIIATPDTIASIQSIEIAVLMGVGRGTGALAGGHLSTIFGIQTSFQIAAGICAIAFALYFISIKFIVKNKVDDTKLITSVHQSSTKLSDAENDIESSRKFSK